MKVAVLVKRVPDTASVFEIGDDGKSVDAGNPKYVISPYDEHAIEQAMLIKEANGADVVIISVGGAETKETIRSALAMGADSGVLVTVDDPGALTPKGVAKLLAAALKALSPDVILAGKQAVDDDASQVPERTAELLELPHVSVVTKFELSGETAAVDRDVEGGHYTFEVPLPAVFSVDKALNTPRYPTLPNIMKAKRKPIEEKGLGDLGLSPGDAAPEATVESMSLPRQDRLEKILEGEPAGQAAELVKALREEEKVL